ncbi:hypothetical protein P8452_69932 [Trifolium repens]|nr:hypothetical protein P8452_69932 [Trifolium repens]
MGLLPAIEELLPGVGQRFCVRHLYNNFRKKFPGKKLKELMWKAANATYANAWHRVMQEIKILNIEAFKHLIKIPPRYWSKSYFTPEPKCDTLVNNMSEAFNSVIVGARAKPIITMIEEIRVYLMERWEKCRQKIGRYGESILPDIKKKLAREASFTNNWMVRHAGEEFYEVRHISATGDKFSVSLGTKECSCRKWMLTGLPCRHAIACMRHMDIDPDQYVPNYFRRETYEACYHPIIYPTNGQNYRYRIPVPYPHLGIIACKLPCPPQQAPTQSGTSQTAPATQAPATQPAASQPALATQSAATQPAAIQPALATQSAATQQAASQPAFATRPVASQSAASNSQQPPSKKGRKDNLSPHQPSHQTQGIQDRNCHVKEATKLLHQEFGVYDVLM